MKLWLNLFLLMCLLAACSPAGTAPGPAPVAASPVLHEFISNVDILANLPAPDCSAGSTPAQQEGPYFKTGSPETTTFFAEGVPGERLILAGTVVDEDCLPIPNALIDFWQADASGEYDNDGYDFRGYQFTDNKGRYYLDTVIPGMYAQRPIRHIHAKVQPPGGATLTTQLYFPDQPVDNLTVTLEKRGEVMLGYFDFAVRR